MRQVLLFVSVLLLGISWAVAQDPQGQSAPASSAQTGHAMAGGETTVQGCLSGSSGSYTLTDKKGNSYQLTGDTAKLSEHVGHEVKVTGTSDAAGSASGGSAMGNSSAQTLQVTSVKHVSKTCKAGANGGEMTH